MAVVLPIWMMIMITKIIVLTNLVKIWSAVTESLLSQHLRMTSYQSFLILAELYFSQMMDDLGLLRWNIFPYTKQTSWKLLWQISMQTILSLPINILVHHPVLTLYGFLSLHRTADKWSGFSRKKESRILPHQHTCHHCNKIFWVCITNLTTINSQPCYG